ncbi:hypothetical protein [Nesterenkonia ebinurensis]|uniref:hypothetical protein n=1 Tax=Nesterenkonia ebinurensis TaxID=2608252 RepID=UPI00123E4209|nr:hypothetical protein [Nesterenkonia ebinurensis]
MTERPDHPEEEDSSADPNQPESAELDSDEAGPAEPESAGTEFTEPEKYSGPTGYLHSRDEDIPDDIERTPGGGLPIAIIVIAALLFIGGFWLFRRWRQQYVDYGDIGGWAHQALQSALAVFGLG